MRFLFKVTMPVEPFNVSVKNGTVAKKLKQIIEALNPEAVYFLAEKGKRTGIFILNVEQASQLPSIAEPFFLTFNAEVEDYLVMSPDDLAKSGIEELGKKWA